MKKSERVKELARPWWIKYEGANYSAVSRIVRDINEQIKRDPRVGSKAEKLNSQFKM
jgi:hypothetical protein